MGAVDAIVPRRRFWSRFQTSTLGPPSYGGGVYGGLPTRYHILNLHAIPPPYAAPPYAAPPHAAPPFQPMPPLPPQQLPPLPMSLQQSPRHSLASNPSVDEEELMQLALAMSMSDAAAQVEEAAVSRSPRDHQLRRHTQPAEARASHQGHDPRCAETLSDEALARALGNIYDEEFAREQQLGELRGAKQQAPPAPLLSLAQPGAPPAAHPPQVPRAGAGQHSPAALPGGAESQPPPRIGGTLGSALGPGHGAAPPPSVDCIGPPGFGRSLAPLLPRSSFTHNETVNPLPPPPMIIQMPAACDTAPPVASHHSGPSSQIQPPPLRPPAGRAACSSGWVAFEAPEASPLTQPSPGAPAPPPAASPDSGVMHSNPLGTFDGTVVNPLRAPQSAAAMVAAPQHGTASSPISRDDSTALSLLEAADTPSNRQTPSLPADDLLAGQAHAHQLPDLIELHSFEPQPLLQPVPAASGRAMQGVGLRLMPAAAAQACDLRTVSWPSSAPGSTTLPAAANSGNRRAGASDVGGATQCSVLAPVDAAAVAAVGPLGQGLAALLPQPAVDDSPQPQLQLRARHEEQRQQEAERQQQGQWMREASVSAANTCQHSAAEAQPGQQDQRQQAVPVPPMQLQRGAADERQHAQGASSALGADCSAGLAADRNGFAAGGGALWSAFFEFPQDSDLPDCHPALLQAARLQQDAAATLAAASVEEPPGRISPAHWRAMHLDIAEAYTCPITQEVTEDPVIAADFFTYERSAIAAWLRHHNTSPMTNAKLAHKELIPNVAARSAIRTLREAGLLDEVANA